MDQPGEEDDDEGLPTEQATVDVASPEGLTQQRRTAKRRDDEAKAFWMRVFADPVGRREMWGILSACHAFEERFAVGPNGFPSPLATWFHAGEQALGLRLYQSWLLLDRAGVLLMQDENDVRFAKPKPRPRRKNVEGT